MASSHCPHWPTRRSDTKQAHLLGSAWFCSESWLPGPLVWLGDVSMSVWSEHWGALTAAQGMWGTAGERSGTAPRDSLCPMSPSRLMCTAGRPAGEEDTWFRGWKSWPTPDGNTINEPKNTKAMKREAISTRFNCYLYWMDLYIMNYE